VIPVPTGYIPPARFSVHFKHVYISKPKPNKKISLKPKPKSPTT